MNDMNEINGTCIKDVHRLEVFAAVAENLSFTRAAEALLLTQSAVSHQVASLERALGLDLFERTGRSVALTLAGRALADQARRVFESLREAESAVRAAAKPGTGRLRIGASPTACQYLVPEALREFRESFPEYSLSITPGDSPLVRDRLLEGSIDLGLMIRPDERVKLTYHDLFQDELGFVLSPLHPWSKSGKVKREELGDQHMVLYSRNSATFRLVQRYFSKMKAPLRDWIELGSMEAIKELVKLGLGVSVMAPWIVRSEVAQKSLDWLAAPGGGLRRRWCIATAAGRKLSLPEEMFVELCRAAAREF
jgi:LysR family transcriptional regulator, low CO2-responsive transcriptional regulator